jgi:hypothetical protein
MGPGGSAAGHGGEPEGRLAGAGANPLVGAADSGRPSGAAPADCPAARGLTTDRPASRAASASAARARAGRTCPADSAAPAGGAAACGSGSARAAGSR